MATKAQRQQIEDNRLKAMQHPLRRSILLLLVEHERLSPVEISHLLGCTVHDATYHTKRLAALDCAELVREEKVRGAIKHYYRATDRHLVDTDEWEGLDSAVKEGLLVSFLQPAVDDFTTSAQAGLLGSDNRFHITRSPLKLDEQGLEDVLAIHRELFERVFEVEREAAERRAESGEPAVFVSSTQSCFAVPEF
jgi:hypothetical protein